MYTGDLVLHGFGESGGYVGSRTPKAVSLKLKAIKKEADAEGAEVRREEERVHTEGTEQEHRVHRENERKTNAEFAESAEDAEKSGFLLSGRWYLLS